MKTNPKLEINQGRSGNNSNQPVNRNSGKETDPRSNKDKHAEEVPRKDYHHLFDGQDASKPRNVTVNYKF